MSSGGEAGHREENINGCFGRVTIVKVLTEVVASIVACVLFFMYVAKMSYFGTDVGPNDTFGNEFMQSDASCQMWPTSLEWKGCNHTVYGDHIPTGLGWKADIIVVAAGFALCIWVLLMLIFTTFIGYLYNPARHKTHDGLLLFDADTVWGTPIGSIVMGLCVLKRSPFPKLSSCKAATARLPNGTLYVSDSIVTAEMEGCVSPFYGPRIDQAVSIRDVCREAVFDAHALYVTAAVILITIKTIHFVVYLGAHIYVYGLPCLKNPCTHRCKCVRVKLERPSPRV